LRRSLRKAPPIPTLQERATTLFEEILDAPADEAIAVIDAWTDMANQFLDEFAERTRPPSIPVGWIRMQMNIKSNGPCPCRGVKVIKENN
jgi:hypothetical protein